MALRVNKLFLPRSLYARAFLILLIPLVALQLVMAVVFVQRHFEGVTRQMTRNIARELAVAQQVIDTSPSWEIAQLRLINLSVPLDFSMELDAEATVDGKSRRRWFDLSGRALLDEMYFLLGDDLSVDLISDDKVVDVRLTTDKGVLHAAIPRSRVSASNPHQLLVLTTITSLLLAAVALLFLRNQLRPILNLAKAADAFGKGQSVPYRPTGAEEVRRAGNAFLAMRGRIERQIEQRTQMLSGVSHDLRTPLTRMKLTVEMADDIQDADELKRDLSEMEEMLDAFLAFARGDQMEDMVSVSAVDLADDVVARCRRSGVEIDLTVNTAKPDDVDIMIREGALRRALQNLITNGARYGSHVKITLNVIDKSAQFTIEDDGPGIPEDKLDYVTRPFTRLDEARNQDKGGGVGLGLSIAQDVARIHGGSLTLGRSASLGGLKAVITLPR